VARLPAGVRLLASLVITVFVRRPPHDLGAARDRRWVSFVLNDTFDQAELLERGWAIDGNRALREVSTQDLAALQLEIVRWTGARVLFA
jgi:hypothetical protein